MKTLSELYEKAETIEESINRLKKESDITRTIIAQEESNNAKRAYDALVQGMFDLIGTANYATLNKDGRIYFYDCEPSLDVKSNQWKGEPLKNSVGSRYQICVPYIPNYTNLICMYWARKDNNLFLRNHYYISIDTGVVVRCTKDSDPSDTCFKGTVVMSPPTTPYVVGLWLETWAKECFKLYKPA